MEQSRPERERATPRGVSPAGLESLCFCPVSGRKRFSEESRHFRMMMLLVMSRWIISLVSLTAAPPRALLLFPGYRTSSSSSGEKMAIPVPVSFLSPLLCTPLFSSSPVPFPFSCSLIQTPALALLQFCITPLCVCVFFIFSSLAFLLLSPSASASGFLSPPQPARPRVPALHERS